MVHLKWLTIKSPMLIKYSKYIFESEDQNSCNFPTILTAVNKNVEPVLNMLIYTTKQKVTK